MRESLRRWWWAWWWRWAWVCLVAASQEHCEVLDLTLQPAAYPLPTNLTVRPSATGWHLNFTLQEKGAPPAACVRLKETESKVQVMLFKGDCVHGKLKKYNYLPRASVPPHTWTTLALDVKDSTVLLTAPDSKPIKVTAVSWSLPHDTLQVTMAHDVEAAVGCHVNCPLYTLASEGPHVKKKVWEDHHEALHFYFFPWAAFDKVHYEVVCKTRQNSEFRRGVDIQPGKDGAAGAWHQVDLEQQETTAKVYLNDKLLEEIQLPDSCTTNMHVIWVVGDASFGFDCDPKQEGEKERDLVTEDTSDNLMHPAVSAGIAVAVLLPIVIGLIIYILWSKRKTPKPSQRGEPQHTLVQFPAINDSLDTSQQRDEVTLRSTRETSLRRSNTWSPGRSAAGTSVWKAFGERTPSGRLIRPVMSQPPNAEEERYSLAERDSLLEDEKWVTH